MNTGGLIAVAALMAPGAVTAPLLAYRIITVRRATDTAAAVLAEHRTATTAAGGAGTPPDGGEPARFPDNLAEVIPLRTDRVA